MQMPAASATARNCCPNKIVIHFTHKRTEAPQLFQHRQHIAGRAAGIGLKQRVSLSAQTVVREVDQQFPQSHYIKTFLRHVLHLLTVKGKIIFLHVYQCGAARLKGNGVSLLLGVDPRAGRLFAVVDKHL